MKEKQLILQFAENLQIERQRSGGPDVAEAFRLSHITRHYGIMDSEGQRALQDALNELVASGDLVVESPGVNGEGEIYARPGAIGPATITMV